MPPTCAALATGVCPPRILSGVASAQPYVISTDGTEVTDQKTGLIWRRCAEGMSWDGLTCAGTVGTYSHEAALQRATSHANNTGITWRLPNIKELAGLLTKASAIRRSTPRLFRRRQKVCFGQLRPTWALLLTPSTSILPLATSEAASTVLASPLCGQCVPVSDWFLGIGLPRLDEDLEHENEEKTVPIRLSPKASRMVPFSRVKLIVGRSIRVARDPEQGAESVERIEAPVEAKREFIEVRL